MEFDARVVAWLLDVGPPDLRTSPLRSMPLALGLVVARVVDGSLEGIRDAYRSARTDLRGHASAAEVEVVQQALEAQAAVLQARAREVGLVCQALRRSPTGGMAAEHLD